MKRHVLHILFLSALLTGFSACSSDSDNPYAHESELRVVHSEVLFPGGSATGYIVVEAPATVTATTESPWVTPIVKGDTVFVTVTANEQYSGRSAVLTLQSGVDAVNVIVQQAGLDFVAKTDSAVIVGDEVNERRYYLHASANVSLSSSDDWISGTLDGDSLILIVEPNTTGHLRTGYLKYTCGPAADSIMVTQASFDDLMGKYYLAGNLNDANGDIASDVVELTKDDSGQPVLSFPTFGWTWQMTFDAATLTLTLPSGKCIGRYPAATGESRYVGTVMWDLSRGAIIYSSAVTMSATFQMHPDYGVVATISDNGSWAGSSCDAIRFELFRSANISRANRMDELVFALVSPFLVEYK